MMAEPVSPVGVAAEPIPPAAVIEPASESVWSRQVPVVMMPEPLSTVVPEWTPVLVAAANLPATVEKQAPPAVIDSAPQPPRVDEASAPAQSVAESTGSNSASTESPEPPVAGSAEPSAEPPVVESVQPAEPAYKGGDQYGPVSANERLWDIAGKVRPDPAIGKDLMMKALFAANPQAFSKPNMDSLRTGAMLRVPTLREIVDATGSRVAKQLLDQQRAAKTPPAPPVLQSPAPATEMPAITEPSLSAPVGGKGISE
jgi:FimV-like protein